MGFSFVRCHTRDVLGLLLFSLYINDVSTDIDSVIRPFVDDYAIVKSEIQRSRTSWLRCQHFGRLRQLLILLSVLLVGIKGGVETKGEVRRL